MPSAEEWQRMTWTMRRMNTETWVYKHLDLARSTKMNEFTRIIYKVGNK